MTVDTAVFEEASRLSANAVPFAIVSIMAAEGSTPRTEGRMLVRPDGSSLGTVGGGPLEDKAKAEALLCIGCRASRVVAYDLGSGEGSAGLATLSMTCGGKVTLSIDVVKSKRPLVIIGGGHVGLALARLGDFLGFHITVVDERPGIFTEGRFPDSIEISSGMPLGLLIEGLKTDTRTAVVIATHSEDELALHALLHRDWAYLGMLGSRAKVKKLFEKLEANGIDKRKLEKVRAPVGLDIGAETPEEIAISVFAEMLTVLNETDGSPLANTKK